MSTITEGVPQLDCCGKTCTGWIIFIGADGKLYAAKCSEKDCQIHYAVCRFLGRCAACRKSFMLQEIICQLTDGGPWVHCECYESNVAYFATCLRCRKTIMSAFDAIPATCSGRTGHIHKACAPKRKLLEDAKDRSLHKRQDDEDHDDDDYQDSQDSLDSNFSGSSSSTSSFTMVAPVSSSSNSGAKNVKAK